MYYILKFLTIKRIKTKANSSIKISLGKGQESPKKVGPKGGTCKMHLSTPWLKRKTSSFSHEPETEPNYVSPPSLQGWETFKKTPTSREEKERNATEFELSLTRESEGTNQIKI